MVNISIFSSFPTENGGLASEGGEIAKDMVLCWAGAYTCHFLSGGQTGVKEPFAAAFCKETNS